MAGTRLTQLTPVGLPGRRYGAFTHTVDLPRWTEWPSGTPIHTLFELSVTKPVAHTWRLASVDLATPAAGLFDPDTFDPNLFATGLAGEVYQAIVKEHSGVSASAALGGVGGQTGVTLTLINALGTGGPGRRFMDTFVTNVEGYGEPYDLLTATLRCRLYAESNPGTPVTIGAELYLQPESYQWLVEVGTPERVTLSFGPDDRRYRQLPIGRVTKPRYPHAPDSTINQPIVPWFGHQLRVPLLPLDADGGRWLVGQVSAVNRLWTIRPDPGSTESGDTPVVYPVKITTGDEAILTISGHATDNITLKQAGQRFEFDTDGAFIYAVTLTLRRSAGGTPCVGSITVKIVLDEDGLPGETLVDRNASAEVTSAIVTSGVFADYTIPFQANKLSRPAYVMPNRGLWLVVKYAKQSGDMQLHVDSTGAYTRGSLATKDTATDSDWIFSGRQQRRGPVRLDYTGIGQLGRNVTTGEIKTRPPVTIPGT